MPGEHQYGLAQTIYIGEAAQKAGVTVKAIRYYERIGLIAEAGRNEGGFRIFPEETVQRIEFIRRSQTLGFTLGEIGEILAVYDQGDCTCGQVRNSLESKVGVIERKLRELKALRRDLHAVMAGKMPKYATEPGNVHFKPEGSKLLAEQVARSIKAAIGKAKD